MHGNAVFFIWVFLLAGCRKPPLSAPDNGSKPAGGILPASYVLHDIWALESFRGRAVRSGDFSKGLPILEIYVADGRVLGHTGCNQLDGKVEAGGKAIAFGNLTVTKVPCPGNFEPDFLRALKQANAYSVKNLRLVLLRRHRELMVFRKID